MSPVQLRAPAGPASEGTGTGQGSADWLRLARLARLLSWLTLGWLGVEAGVAIGAAVAAGSVALLAFGLDSGIEAVASVIIIWRFTGTRLASATAERRAQKLVAVSFYLLAPYVAVEAIRALVAGDRAEASVVGLVLTAGTALRRPAWRTVLLMGHLCYPVRGLPSGPVTRARVVAASCWTADGSGT